MGRVIRLVPLLLIVLLATGASAAPRAAATPHLTLSVTPATAPVNALVTLRIGYVGVGLYDTSVTVTPADALVFDPPRAMPCRGSQDPNACTQLTFRARRPGTVTIHASAYGEIYDPGCACWRFTAVSDDGPAVLTLTGSERLLPLLRR